MQVLLTKQFLCTPHRLQMQKGPNPSPVYPCKTPRCKEMSAQASFFSSPSKEALVMAGEALADGGEAGWSPVSASRLRGMLAFPGLRRRQVAWVFVTYPNAFVWATAVGGVPVREDAPDSSPGRPKPPPGTRRRPLLLRELNMEVGPNEAVLLGVRVAEPLRRRRSSEPIWFCRAWLYAEKFLASPRPAGGRPPGPPLELLRALSAAF